MIKRITSSVTVSHLDLLTQVFLRVCRVGCFYASEERFWWVFNPEQTSVGAVNSDISLRSITAITDWSIIGSLLRHLLSKDSVTSVLSLKRTMFGWDSGSSALCRSWGISDIPTSCVAVISRDPIFILLMFFLVSLLSSSDFSQQTK